MTGPTLCLWVDLHGFRNSVSRQEFGLHREARLRNSGWLLSRCVAPSEARTVAAPRHPALVRLGWDNAGGGRGHQARPARVAAALTVRGGAWPRVAEPGPQRGAQVRRLCFLIIPYGQDERVGKQQRAGKRSLRPQLPPPTAPLLPGQDGPGCGEGSACMAMTSQDGNVGGLGASFSGPGR